MPKQPTPVVQKRDKNTVRGEAPSSRNVIVQEMITRGWGSGAHQSRGREEERGRLPPKHKKDFRREEYMTDPTIEALTSPMARFEEGKPADPTKNMSPEDAAEWKRQTELHKDEFKAASSALTAAWGRTLVAEGLEDTCWEGYEAVGFKEKGGQSVPNCVPVKTAAHPLDKVRGHELWPATVARKVPALYSQEKEKDPTAWVKLFSPYTNAVWYITEYDPSSKEAFGWADLGMGGGELGYISIRELEGLNKKGLPLVERDLYWKPVPLSRAKSSRMASEQDRTAKFPKGVTMTVDEVAEVVGPEFKEMNENPPESVVKLREDMQGGKTASDPLVVAWGRTMIAEGSPEADFTALDEDADPTSHDQNLASTWEKVGGRKVAASTGWTAVFDALDKKFSAYNTKTVTDWNKVYNQMRKDGVKDAGAAAHFYAEYRAKRMSKQQATDLLAEEGVKPPSGYEAEEA